MTIHQLIILLKRLQDGEYLNEEEQLRLEQWADEAVTNRELLTEIRSGLLPVQDLLFFKENEELLDQKFSRLVNEYMDIAQPVRKPVRKIARYAVAATIALLLSGGALYLWWQNSKERGNRDKQKIVQLDIPAGKKGAVLTLDDGTQVILDSITGGIVASQGGTSITLEDGRLAYNPNGTVGERVLYNTMSTPKARQFQMTLPDGTMVWLNAASSIRFPTKFNEQLREVRITGEAYFEVAKNEKAPFRVLADNKVTIDVLGTHFNVNAYEPDQQISTTLLQGSVKVSAGKQSNLLKPGQQALSDEQKIQLVNNVNLEQVIAWKNGSFNSYDITLEALMKEVGRWYDVEVEVDRSVADAEFQGELSRDLSLKDLMSSLEKLGVRYRMEGRKLIILP